MATSIVQRWAFSDPAPGANPSAYTLPLNPAQMSSPFPGPSIFTVKTTVAADGQAIIFEGQTPPIEWSFNGTCYQAADATALLAWRSKRSRTYITDHLNRKWMVIWSDLQLIPKGSLQYPDKQTYAAKVLVLGGPS